MPHSTDPDKAAVQLSNLLPAPPPPPEGNQRTRSHGGYSVVTREEWPESVARLYDALAVDAPLKENGELPPADEPFVALLAEAMCRLRRVSAYVNSHGELDDKGNVRPAATLERSLRKEVASYLIELARTPRSRGRLGMDIRAASLDAASALSEPDPRIREQLLRRLGLIGENGGGSDGD